MTTDEQQCIEHLKKGVLFKRQGDYNSAINEYGEAFNIYPYNRNIYNNLAKIFIGINQQEYALRNLLTYKHLILHNEKINMDAYDYASTFYNWSGSINNKKIPNDFVLLAVSKDFNLAKIISDINLTFNIGLSYLLKNQNLIRENQIPGTLINNEINNLLGKPTDGLSLSGSDFSHLVRVIGLSFLLTNLVTNKNLSEENIIHIYIDENYNLDII